METPTKNIPKVIERKEPPVVSRVIGQFECTGKGNEVPDFGVKPCGSTLEITIDSCYRTTIRRLDCSTEEKSTFTCPVCSCETDFDLPDEVRLYMLPKKSEFLEKNATVIDPIEESDEDDDPLSADWCGTVNPSGCLPREMIDPRPKKRPRIFLPRNLKKALRQATRYDRE